MSDLPPRRVLSLRDPTPADFRGLLPYVAALELEVDRLRRHNRLVHQETRAAGGRGPGGVAARPAGIARLPPGPRPGHRHRGPPPGGAGLPLAAAVAGCPRRRAAAGAGERARRVVPRPAAA